MNEKRFKTFTIIIKDDIDTVQTYIRSELSAPQLMDKIFELKEENERLKSRNNYNLEDCLLEIAELKEENEQLQKELDNFKPVMFQDMRKGTVILYSKGDIDV